MSSIARKPPQKLGWTERAWIFQSTRGMECGGKHPVGGCYLTSRLPFSRHADCNIALARVTLS